MEFDELTIVLTILRPDAPELDDEAAEALQNAHMAHLADLHEAGYLLAGGPLDDPEFRGLSIFNVGPERARELRAQDPAVHRRAALDQGHPVACPGRRRPFHSDTLPALARRSRRLVAEQAVADAPHVLDVRARRAAGAGVTRASPACASGPGTGSPTRL